MPPPLSAEVFAAQADVSRETLDRLRIYADLLCRWQRRINLVANSTVADLWRRHFLDSAQLAPLIPAGSGPVIDLGSGAGFPGLVLAILGISPVILIESTQRKCVFLQEVARATATDVTIFCGRAEHFRPPAPARAVTARALASLENLLPLAAPLLAPDGICLFLKGANAADELTKVAKTWHITAERLRSISDDRATIVRLCEVSPK